MSNVINTHATNLRDEIQSVNLLGEVIVTFPIPNCEVVDLDTPELGDDYAIQDKDSGVILLMASHVDLEI